MEWLRRLLLPIDQGSEFAKHIDFMYMAIFWLSVVLFLMLMIPMVYFAWRYRFKPGRVTPHQTHNTTMEVTWTVVPLLSEVHLVPSSETLAVAMNRPPRVLNTAMWFSA